MTFPNSNLPPSAQPWAAEVQAQINAINDQLNLTHVNNGARDAQIRASYQTTGVTQDSLEKTLDFLRSNTFRYGTYTSNASWTSQPASTTETLVAGTKFWIDLERRPLNGHAFVTVSCDADLSCTDTASGSNLRQNIFQYISVQSYAGDWTSPYTGSNSDADLADGKYNQYVVSLNTIRSGIVTDATNTTLLGGSSITSTAGFYINKNYTYRISTYINRNTGNSTSTARFGGNISPQTMTIQTLP